VRSAFGNVAPFLPEFAAADCSLQRQPKKSAETAEKHGGIESFDRVSNDRADQPSTSRYDERETEKVVEQGVG